MERVPEPVEFEKSRIDSKRKISEKKKTRQCIEWYFFILINLYKYKISKFLILYIKYYVNISYNRNF